MAQISANRWIWCVKADESPVTIADRNTERLIRDRLAAAFPADAILGEEFGVKPGTSGAQWIIDPIDGTRSFITGHPLFGMLLGRWMRRGRRSGWCGCLLGETFVGARGQGASLNGAPIRARATTDLAAAMVYINEAEKIEAADPARFARLCRIGHTRRMAPMTAIPMRLSPQARLTPWLIAACSPMIICR